ncbi:hypothetical protein DERF_014219 [Dermatophagoides farinae]|uniref:Uncharacterized protein n=1 Tax=Dermatophagoides farinae TaxID=6954 RepID=A0A922HNL9_DERFA|nr:hypothetical protein DERF_014219 [Dermatophagoides farinae]
MKFAKINKLKIEISDDDDNDNWKKVMCDNYECHKKSSSSSSFEFSNRRKKQVDACIVNWWVTIFNGNCHHNKASQSEKN